jgi:predicted ATPase
MDMSKAYQEMVQSLPITSKAIAEKLSSRKEMKEYLQLQMKAQLAKIIYGNKGYYKVLSTEDRAIQKAVATFLSSYYNTLIRR